MRLQLKLTLWVPLMIETFGYGAFTLDVNSLLNGNLGGILGGIQC